MIPASEKERRAAQVAHALASAVRAGEVVPADALRILRHELRRLNTGKAETIPVRSVEAQRVLDKYEALGLERPRISSPEALNADHVWPITAEQLQKVTEVDAWVNELRHLAAVVCVTAAENHRLQTIERTTPGPEKYAIAGVEFTTEHLPWRAPQA